MEQKKTKFFLLPWIFYEWNGIKPRNRHARKKINGKIAILELLLQLSRLKKSLLSHYRATVAQLLRMSLFIVVILCKHSLYYSGN